MAAAPRRSWRCEDLRDTFSTEGRDWRCPLTGSVSQSRMTDDTPADNEPATDDDIKR